MEAKVRRWDDEEAELALAGDVEGEKAVSCQALYRLEAATVPPVLAEAREALWRARFEAEEVTASD
jgi:hypothetical protein